MNPLGPLRRIYLRIKEQYPGYLVLYQLGDFYEAFGVDAETCARVLDILLITRSIENGAPRIAMAGIMASTLESSVERLTALGYKVAVARGIEADTWYGKHEVTCSGEGKQCSTPNS